MYIFDEPTENAGWPVFSRYFATGRWLKAAVASKSVTGGSSLHYLEAELAGSLEAEFARINRPRLAKLHDAPARAKAKALLAYTQRFGSLGYVHPNEAKKTGVRDPGLELDDIPWVLAHAAAVDCVTTLAGAVQTKEKSLMVAQLRALTQAQDGKDGLIVPGRLKMATGGLTGLDTKPTESQAWDICGQLLNPMLNGHRRLTDGVIQTKIAAPIDLIYWRISDDIEAARYKRCGDCLTFFAQTNGRQMYCLPIDGGKESQCAMRDRNKRNRAGVGRKRPDVALLRPLLLKGDDVLSFSGIISLT